MKNKKMTFKIMSAFDFNIKGGGWDITSHMIAISALVFALFALYYIYTSTSTSIEKEENLIPTVTNREILQQNIPRRLDIDNDTLCDGRLVRTEIGDEFTCVDGSHQENLVIQLHEQTNRPGDLSDIDVEIRENYQNLTGGIVTRGGFLFPESTGRPTILDPEPNPLLNNFSPPRFADNNFDWIFRGPNFGNTNGWDGIRIRDSDRLENRGSGLPFFGPTQSSPNEIMDNNDVIHEYVQGVFEDEELHQTFTDATLVKMTDCGLWTEMEPWPRRIEFDTTQNAIFYPDELYKQWYEPSINWDFNLLLEEVTDPEVTGDRFRSEDNSESRLNHCYNTSNWNLPPPIPLNRGYGNGLICNPARIYYGRFKGINEPLVIPRLHSVPTVQGGREVHGVIMELNLKEDPIRPEWKVSPNQTRNPRTGEPWSSNYILKTLPGRQYQHTPVAVTSALKIIDMEQANLTISSYTNDVATGRDRSLTFQERRAAMDSRTGLREMVPTPMEYKTDPDHELAGENFCVKVSITVSGTGDPRVTYEKLPYYRIENRKFTDPNILTTQDEQDQNIFVQRVPRWFASNPFRRAEGMPRATPGANEFDYRIYEERYSRCFVENFTFYKGKYRMQRRQAGVPIFDVNVPLDTRYVYGVPFTRELVPYEERIQDASAEDEAINFGICMSTALGSYHLCATDILTRQETGMDTQELLEWGVRQILGLDAKINTQVRTDEELEKAIVPPSYSYVKTKGEMQIKVDTNVTTELGREVYYSMKQAGKVMYSIGKNIFTGNYTDINIEAADFAKNPIPSNSVVVSYITSGTKTESGFSDVTVSAIPTTGSDWTADTVVYSFPESSLNILPSKGDVLAITVFGTHSASLDHESSGATITVTGTVTRTVNGALMGGLTSSENYHIQLSNLLIFRKSEEVGELVDEDDFTIISARVVRHNESLRVGVAVSDISDGKVKVDINV